MKNLSIERLVLVSFIIGPIVFIVLNFINVSVTLHIIAGIVFVFYGYYLSKRVKNPLDDVILFLNSIKQGEFNVIEQYSHKSKPGNIWESLINLASFYEKQMLKFIIEALRLSSINSEMLIIIDDFLSKAATMNHVSTSVASSTEELSKNTNVVSQKTEEVSSSTSIVSSNTEQMTSTVNEISNNAEKTRAIALQAVDSVKQATNKVTELEKKAIEISKIIDVIGEISEQTKLLALNATIEAARAGEGGKGFSVVANEVKELASQTALATIDIKKSIEDIQSSSNLATNEIVKINDIISQVEENISSIATAVEEQNVTTRDIAANIDTIDLKIKEIKQNISKSAKSSQLVVMDMGKVSIDAKQMLGYSININSELKSLNYLGENLKNYTSHYKFSPEKQTKINKMTEIAELIQAREKDHLIWVKKVQEAIAERADKIDVQKDPTLCGLGKFLNSSARKEIENHNPKIAQIFRNMDDPHKKLHQSAVKLEQMLQNRELARAEIDNYYNDTTLHILNELIELFHQVINENFNSLKIA